MSNPEEPVELYLNGVLYYSLNKENARNEIQFILTVTKEDHAFRGRLQGASGRLYFDSCLYTHKSDLIRTVNLILKEDNLLQHLMVITDK